MDAVSTAEDELEDAEEAVTLAEDDESWELDDPAELELLDAAELDTLVDEGLTDTDELPVTVLADTEEEILLEIVEEMLDDVKPTEEEVCELLGEIVDELPRIGKEELSTDVDDITLLVVDGTLEKLDVNTEDEGLSTDAQGQ